MLPSPNFDHELEISCICRALRDDRLQLRISGRCRSSFSDNTGSFRLLPIILVPNERSTSRLVFCIIPSFAVITNGFVPFCLNQFYFWRVLIRLVGLLLPLFRRSGDVCPGFPSESHSRLCALCVCLFDLIIFQ